MIKNTQKQIISYYILFIICICYILMLFYNNRQNQFVNFETIDQIIDDDNVHIDEIVLNKEIVEIRGWKIDTEDKSNIFNMEVVLEELENQEYIKVPTVMEKREDISFYFGNDTHYENSGFVGRILISNLNNSKYRVCILKKNEQDICLYLTNTNFLYNEGNLVVQ